MHTWIWKLLSAAVVALALTATHARAQSCDDFNECTMPDMCVDGMCSGVMVSGGNCDDGNPCTANDTCANGVCQGTPNDGATCGATGCEGTCNNAGFCIPDPLKQGESCSDGFGACTTNDICLGTVCFGELTICPDADGNPCTLDFCNPLSGSCQQFDVPPCDPTCETCNAEGECIPANEGTACNDFNECTGDGMCNAGSCQDGSPITPGAETPTNTPPVDPGTPTPTHTPGAPTATFTQTTAPDTFTPTGVPTGTAATATPTDSPTDSPTPLPTPTDTPIEVATDTPTEAPTDTPIADPTDTPTGVPTGTVTATVTPTGTPAGTATATVTFTPTGIPTGTATATVTPTGVPTGTATATATGTPAGTASATVTATATLTPTVTTTRTSTPTPPPTNTRTATQTNTPLPIAASLIVGSVTGEPGATATFPVTLETDGEVAGVQLDIAFEPDTAILADGEGDPTCAVNPEIEKDATSFAYQPSGCTPGDDCTGIRAIVLSLSNLDPIPDGSQLFTCTVTIAADAEAGEYPLTCSNPGAGDPDGERLGVDCTDGTVTVAVPTDATIVVGDIVATETGEAQVLPLTVSLQTEVDVAGTQNDLVFPDDVGVVAGSNGRPLCSVNEAINKGGTAFAFQPVGCTPGDDCTGIRALVLALDNVDPIPSGSALYSCSVSVGPLDNGTYPIECTGAGASDPAGESVPTDCVDGEVIIGIVPTITVTSTPTATPTATMEPDVTPTATSTQTVTPSRPPTPTPTRRGGGNDEDDGCQVVAPADTGSAWLLLLPVAALLIRRRR